MDERIKKLAELASHQSPDGYPVVLPYNEDFVNKLAELIVLECADVAYDAVEMHCDAGKVYHRIKDHFEVF